MLCLLLMCAGFSLCDDWSISVGSFCNEISDSTNSSDKLLSIRECTLNNNGIVSCQVTSTFSIRNCTINHRRFCNDFKRISDVDYCKVFCPNYYRCQTGKCLERSTICDGNVCGGCDEDDEWKTGIGFPCIRNGEVCRLPQQLLLDNVRDCDQGSDLCYTTQLKISDSRDLRNLTFTKFDNSRCFMCLDESMIVPREKVCDGIFHCSDLSDECLCEGKIPDLCNKIIMKDSPSTQHTPSCSIGDVACGNGTCISRSSVCDSIGDCDDNSDEKFSYCQGTLQCKDGLVSNKGEDCRCPQTQSSMCSKETMLQPSIIGNICDGIGQCLPQQRFDIFHKFTVTPVIWPSDLTGYAADECEAVCDDQNDSLYNCTAPYQRPGFFEPFTTPVVYGKPLVRYFDCECLFPGAYLCDGNIECDSKLPDHDELNCTDRYYCQAGALVSISNDQLCDGVLDCDDKSDETKDRCSGRFYCKSLEGYKVSIKNSSVCDFHINCDNSLDEHNCDDGRFYCENGNPLFVRNKQIFDGRRDCSDFSDECPTKSTARNEDIFSSRYELIANPILRALVWIMGIISVTGNVIVIAGETKALRKLVQKRGSGSAPLRTNLLLVLNLAIADVLMGVYLIMLGIVGALYSGEFCLYNLNWVSSNTCTLMGVLVVLSSETSVITMVFLTSCRLYAVLKPFQAANKPTKSTVVILIIASWCIAFTLALLPLSENMQYLFSDKAVISENPFFENATVTFDCAKVWSEKLVTFHPRYSNASNHIVTQIRDSKSWPNLKKLLEAENIPNVLNVTRYLGYYSANSVCIPRLFVTTQDKAWGFSLSISLFNFVAFAYVLLAYCLILWQSKKQEMHRASITSNKIQNNKKMEMMQRKILRLVITDFCCWVPISVIAFAYFNNVSISSVAYVISAIVLLPINSALNPILYSSFVEKVTMKIRKCVRKQQAEDTHSTVTHFLAESNI